MLDWLRKKMHRHALVQRRRWALVNGDLACLRVYECACGHTESKALLLIATAADLAEAQTNIVNTDTPA